jgi:hypothetical protein
MFLLMIKEQADRPPVGFHNEANLGPVLPNHRAFFCFAAHGQSDVNQKRSAFAAATQLPHIVGEVATSAVCCYLSSGARAAASVILLFPATTDESAYNSNRRQNAAKSATVLVGSARNSE